MTIKEYADLIKKKIDPDVLIKFNNDKKLVRCYEKKIKSDLSYKSVCGWKSKMNFLKVLDNHLGI